MDGGIGGGAENGEAVLGGGTTVYHVVRGTMSWVPKVRNHILKNRN